MDRQISVIIPVYNAEKTLRRCVESLVYGNEQNIEIILVDDCSQDNSWKLCQQLQMEFDNVCSVQNKKNSGVSYTRNHGVDIAHTEYIMFVDSDDWVDERFVKTILEMVKKENNMLITCGFHYIDELTSETIDYQWDKNCNEKEILICGAELFDAAGKVMLQNVWNKIFCSEIIRTHAIRFDEKQSMGEDFQFVLDYMQAAEMNKLIVINEPLYYYVRANNYSLMSKFGLVEYDTEFKRYEQLLYLSDENNIESQKKYQEMLGGLKNSFVYHIMHDKRSTRKEKLDKISIVMQDGKEKKYYIKQKEIIFKEKIMNLIK